MFGKKIVSKSVLDEYRAAINELTATNDELHTKLAAERRKNDELRSELKALQEKNAPGAVKSQEKESGEKEVVVKKARVIRRKNDKAKEA